VEITSRLFCIYK